MLKTAGEAGEAGEAGDVKTGWVRLSTSAPLRLIRVHSARGITISGALGTVRAHGEYNYRIRVVTSLITLQCLITMYNVQHRCCS